MPWELCPKLCWRGCRGKKVSFWGLKGQFEVKNDPFKGVIVKIGYLSPILASRTPLWAVFLEYAIGIVIEGMLERF